ncbi:MBL fold metallo-hydrolase [Polycladidibacter stylochi]|uniref:MBL fold metallo-hydrolase n=1 Tax=Polycladidibacter stylochi TaxID=1807766 RepID=UPI0009E7C302|nr:MBL fold metallo-hydrolase [Pseudovibrio stylochi]
MTKLLFDQNFEPRYGQAVSVRDGLLRITCNNPSPLTFHGTNSYLVGKDRLILVDPGPVNEQHLTALLDAIDGRPLDAILITHCHVDHSPLAVKLKELTNAPIWGCAQYSRAPAFEELSTTIMDGSNDANYAPDRVLEDGEHLTLAGSRLKVIATPGHTMNHLCFSLLDYGVILSGDHVMGWSTTVVAPPDGDMASYMASLNKLGEQGELRYFPAHGGEIHRPLSYLKALAAHRRTRENAILSAVQNGCFTVSHITDKVYSGLETKLIAAASLNVLAHLQHLYDQKLITYEGPISFDSHFRACERPS